MSNISEMSDFAEPKCKVVFKTFKCENNKLGIFLTRKLKRNGLLEKRIIKKNGKIKTGRWEKDEHSRFINACLTYGPDWRKVNNKS